MIKYEEVVLINWDDFRDWMIDNKDELLNTCKSRFKELSFNYWDDNIDNLEELEIDELLSEDPTHGDGFLRFEKITTVNDEFDAFRKVVAELFYKTNPELKDKDVIIFVPL